MTITRSSKINLPTNEQSIDLNENKFVYGSKSISDQNLVNLIDETSFSMGSISRRQQANNIIESYVPWAIATTGLSLPLIDMVVTISMQMRMLSKLSELYHVPFKRNAAQGAIIALMFGSMQSILGMNVIAFSRLIPIIGALANIAVAPTMAAASTYAIGQVFVNHFECGGTYLNFRSSAKKIEYKRHFTRMFKLL